MNARRIVVFAALLAEAVSVLCFTNAAAAPATYCSGSRPDRKWLRRSRQLGFHKQQLGQ